MVCPVLCTADCYVTVITLFIKKVAVVRPIFFLGGGGPDLPPPVVAPLSPPLPMFSVFMTRVVKLLVIYVGGKLPVTYR